MEQITLNFDSTGFEGFTDLHEFLSFCTLTLKDDKGRVIHKNVQAMELDKSPSQWSQKVCQGNNTCINLNDLHQYTTKFKDTRWIDFAYWKYRIQENADLDDLKRMRDELERKIKDREAMG